MTGLSNGRVGLLIRLHHVIADGVAALALIGSLFDAAEDTPAPIPPAWTPGPVPPNDQLLTDSVHRRAAPFAEAASWLLRPERWWEQSTSTVGPMLQMLRDGRRRHPERTDRGARRLALVGPTWSGPGPRRMRRREGERRGLAASRAARRTVGAPRGTAPAPPFAPWCPCRGARLRRRPGRQHRLGWHPQDVLEDLDPDDDVDAQTRPERIIGIVERDPAVERAIPRASCGPAKEADVALELPARHRLGTSPAGGSSSSFKSARSRATSG